MFVCIVFYLYLKSSGNHNRHNVIAYYNKIIFHYILFQLYIEILQEKEKSHIKIMIITHCSFHKNLEAKIQN